MAEETVTYHFSIKREKFEYTVRATHVGGGLCISRPVKWSYGPIVDGIQTIEFYESDGYCVSHQKSGMVLVETKLLRTARWRKQQLSEIRPVWDMDMPDRNSLTPDEYNRTKEIWSAAIADLRHGGG